CACTKELSILSTSGVAKVFISPTLKTSLLNWSAIFSTTPIGRPLIASWYCDGNAGLKVNPSEASTPSGTVTITALAFTIPAGVVSSTPQGLSQLIELTGVFSLIGTPL